MRLYFVFLIMALGNAVYANSLSQAIKTANIAKLKTMLKKSTQNINELDENGLSPLYIAVNNNNVEIVTMLLKAGANVNQIHNTIDRTPWLRAGALGHAKLIAVMKNYLVDYAITNYYGGTALIPAAEKGHAEAVKELLSTPIKVNHINNLSWSALLEVVILGNDGASHQAIAKLLLKAGADPYLKDNKGYDCFYYAKSRNLKNIEEILLAYKK